MSVKNSEPTPEGKRLKRKREAAGWTRYDLGNAVGLTDKAIRDYEEGSRPVAPEILAKVEARLDEELAKLKASSGGMRHGQ
jgi:transcriptional regulator with XRE-family HTH domain